MRFLPCVFFFFFADLALFTCPSHFSQVKNDCSDRENGLVEGGKINKNKIDSMFFGVFSSYIQDTQTQAHVLLHMCLCESVVSGYMVGIIGGPLFFNHPSNRTSRPIAIIAYEGLSKWFIL